MPLVFPFGWLFFVIGENACFSLLCANKEAGTFSHELKRTWTCLNLCNQREVSGSDKHFSLCSLWLILFHTCQRIAVCSFILSSFYFGFDIMVGHCRDLVVGK